MTKAKIFIGLAMTLMALIATASPASAWFKDLRKAPAEPGHCESQILAECGENLTEAVLSVGTTSRFICPTNELHVVLWRIETKETQALTPEGPHELITWLCESGEAIVKTSEGEVKSKAKLEKCSVQLEQEKGQFNNVRGKDETECVIKASAGLCVVKVPASPSNQGLGFSTLSNGEDTKHGKYLLIKSEIEGITANSNSEKLCGFKTTTEGKLKGDIDLFGQSAI